MGNSCSVVNTYVAELRDVNVQTDRMRFRRNLERIGEAQAYELSRMLNYSEKKVQTPLGVAAANTFDDQVVVATVFRAGLPMHHGFLNVFDKAENAFVSAYRYYKDKSAARWMCTLSISLLPTSRARHSCWWIPCWPLARAWSWR